MVADESAVADPAPGEPVEVIAYSGYRGEEEPRAVVVEGRRLAVSSIEDRWLEPDGRYFKVRVADGRRYLLRCTVEEASWSLIRRWDS